MASIHRVLQYEEAGRGLVGEMDQRILAIVVGVYCHSAPALSAFRRVPPVLFTSSLASGLGPPTNRFSAPTDRPSSRELHWGIYVPTSGLGTYNDCHVWMVPYVATTEGITVTVRPAWLDGQSDFMNRRFAFGYFIQIFNGSATEVQLLCRHWLIRDGEGRVQEVEGEGVVGQQPVIPPGGRHEYSSGCVLGTFSGSMEGTYLMRRKSGERFRIAIPRFDLRAAAN